MRDTIETSEAENRSRGRRFGHAVSAVTIAAKFFSCLRSTGFHDRPQVFNRRGDSLRALREGRRHYAEQQPREARLATACGELRGALPDARRRAVPTPRRRRRRSIASFCPTAPALASFGEWARVDDRLVFSMPLAAGRRTRGPASRVAPGAARRPGPHRALRRPRARRQLRGDPRRGRLRALERGGRAERSTRWRSSPIPTQRLATAERARRSAGRLAGCALRLPGRRGPRVRRRARRCDRRPARVGRRQRDSARPVAADDDHAPPREPLLPPPNHAEIVQQLMAASTLVDSPAEKVSLLQIGRRAHRSRGRSAAGVVRVDDSRHRARRHRRGAADRRARMAGCATGTLAEAVAATPNAPTSAASSGCAQRVREQDAASSARRRPDDVAAIVATLDAHLDAAHRLRLAHDQWLLASSALRALPAAPSTPYVPGACRRARDSLDDIRSLAGPAAAALAPARATSDSPRAGRHRAVEPPAELAAVHAVFRSAYALAENAVQLRLDAVDAAPTSSSRARRPRRPPGAHACCSRARRADLDAALRPPLSARAASQP